jgi:hypothetical protein
MTSAINNEAVSNEDLTSPKTRIIPLSYMKRRSDMILGQSQLFKYTDDNVRILKRFLQTDN